MLNNHTFNPTLEKAIIFAVGNTLVCDDLDEAKALSWSGERHKGNVQSVLNYFTQLYQVYLMASLFVLEPVVTVDGILLTKSGTMTGGTSGGMEARSNKWDDKKIEGTQRIH